MQPIDHTSSDLLYESHSNNTSGGLYHLVAMYSVNIFFLSFVSSNRGLANPKSHILITQSLFTRRFFGFYKIILLNLQGLYELNFYHVYVSFLLVVDT